MKKLVLIMVIACCLVFSSCEQEKNLCFYGFFSDKAFALIYNSQRNTVYHVDLPLNMILDWSEINGIDSLNKAAQDFCGIKADGIMLSDYLNWQAFCEILDKMGNRESTPEDRLQTFVEKATIFSEEPMLGKINKLLSGDITQLLRVLTDNQPDVCYLDGTQFSNYDDIDYSQKYILDWMSQIIE